MHYELTATSTGVAAIRLVYDGIPDLHMEETHRLRVFPISPYTNIYEKDDSDNGLKYRDLGALNCINNFFQTLSEDDIRVITLTLLLAHSRILKAFESNEILGLTQIAGNIGELVCKNFTNIALMEKFHSYVLANIDPPIKTDWGSRPIDTESMTYNRDDVLALHSLVLLGKLMLPIFGVVITKAQQFPLGPKVAEVHCLPFIMPLINTRAANVKSKLLRYIDAATSKSFVEDATVIHSGFTKNYAETILLAMFLVRNTVNHNVYMPGSNLITALNGCVTQTARAFRKDAMKSNHITMRTLKTSVAEETNQSRMEIDSITSAKTADVPLIAKAYVKDIVARFINNHGLDYSLHKRIAQNIRAEVIQISTISKLIVETLFCKEFNGINNLNYLQLTEMSELLAATQQMIARYGYADLAHACTVKRTGNIREQTESDRAMVIGYNKSREYKRYVSLLEELPLDVRELRNYLNSILTSIVTDFTAYELANHTSNEINSLLNAESANGATMVFNITLIDQLYSFLYDCWMLK